MQAFHNFPRGCEATNPHLASLVVYGQTALILKGDHKKFDENDNESDSTLPSIVFALLRYE